MTIRLTNLRIKNTGKALKTVLSATAFKKVQKKWLQKINNNARIRLVNEMTTNCINQSVSSKLEFDE